MSIFFIFIIFELVSYVLFSFLNAVFFPEDEVDPVPGRCYLTRSNFKKQFWHINIDNIKGFLERVMLVVGLAHDYKGIIIVFSALKLGTRFDTENNCKVTTNYFLIGNIISIIIAILIVELSKKYTQ